MTKAAGLGRHLVLCAALAGLGVGCGKSGGQPGGGPTGSIHAALSADAADDIGSVRLDVQLLGMTVTSRTLSAGASPAPGIFGDAFFVLPPGLYTVVATPFGPDGEQSRDCASASATGRVSSGLTDEITLTLECRGVPNGGLDVVVKTEHPPVITDLTFKPSKFTPVCAPTTITVTASDPDGEPLTYAWSIVSEPAGAEMQLPPGVTSELTSMGPTATFDAGLAGDYELQVVVTDPSGLTASLQFPVHVVAGTGNGCTGSQQLSGYLGTAPRDTNFAALVGPVPPATTVNLAISLPMRDPQGLQDFIHAASDPTNPAYRKYMTPAQFAATHGADPGDYKQLLAWATSHGLTVANTYSNNLLVDVTGPASTVAAALYANLVYRVRSDGGKFVTVDREPSLDLTVPILHIAGLGEYTAPHHSAINGSAPGMNYWGKDYRNAYLGPATPCAALDGTGQTVGLFELDGFNMSDIVDFGNAQTPPMPTASVSVVTIDGFSGGAGPNADETVMDIEAVNGIAPKANIVVFEGPGFSTVLGESLLTKMATDGTLTVASTSWSFPRGPGGQQAINQMAAQGISFFQSSGDSGFIGDPEDSRDYANQTLVGGTMLATNALGSNPYYASEATWNDASGKTGGGVMNGGNLLCWPWPGCSHSTDIPDYQAGVNMTINGGSTQFRNFPDVAMVAENVELFFGGSPRTFAGTSNSAPLWAGFMALANQQSLANGVGPVGFASPVLYDIGLTVTQPAPNLYTTCFNDIADGVSNGGFMSVAGYDLATGWGSPKCGLITQLSSNTPLTAAGFSELQIHIQNGDDGIRDDSEASVDVFLTGVPFPIHDVFHPQNATGWDPAGAVHDLIVLLPSAVAAGGIDHLVFNLVTHNNFPETNDNWSIGGLDVRLVNPTGPSSCVTHGEGTPLSRLMGSSSTGAFMAGNGCGPESGGASPVNQVSFIFGTGGDDLRNDSELDIAFFESGQSSPWETAELKADGDPGFDKFTQHTLTYTLTTGAHPLSDFDHIDLTLVSHDDGFLETDDAWQLFGINVMANPSGGPPSCLVDLEGLSLQTLGDGNATFTLTPRSGCP